MEEKLQGVILAAGHGSRMGPFGEQYPKPIAPICNKPLLAYQLEHMRDIGIDDIIIVIGHLGHRITQALGDGAEYGVRLQYIEQEKRLGLAHAVGQLEPFITHPFLLMLGDIFFEVSGLATMRDIQQQSNAAAVLAVKEEPDIEAVKKNFSVMLCEDGSVRRVIEKPRHVTNNLKGCGLYLFDLPIFDAIRRTPRTAMRDEYELTDSIQILIDFDYCVQVARVVDWDMNLTYIDDLIACCVHQLHNLEKDVLLGSGVHLDPSVTLSECVIGDNAKLIGTMQLERCVVLPGVRIEASGVFRDTVFMPQGNLQAGHEKNRYI